MVRQTGLPVLTLWIWAIAEVTVNRNRAIVKQGCDGDGTPGGSGIASPGAGRSGQSLRRQKPGRHSRGFTRARRADGAWIAITTPLSMSGQGRARKARRVCAQHGAADRQGNRCLSLASPSDGMTCVVLVGIFDTREKA